MSRRAAIASILLGLGMVCCHPVQADTLPCMVSPPAPPALQDARALYAQGRFQAAAGVFAALAGKNTQPAATRLDALSGLERALKAQACDTEAIDAQRARLALAERTGNTEAIRVSQARIARLLVTRDTGEAERLARQVLTGRSSATPPDDSASDAYTTLAIVATKRGAYSDAKSLLDAALSAATSSLRRAEAWRTLGVLCDADPQFGDAARAWRESLAEAERASDAEARALAQIYLAGTFHNATEQPARALYTQAREQARVGHMRRVEAIAEFEEGRRLRRVAVHAERVRGAQLLQQASEHDAEIGDFSQEHVALLELASARFALGDYAGASRALERSVAQSRRLGYPADAAKANHLLALIAMRQPAPDSAAILAQLEAALTGMDGSEARVQQARVLHDMAIFALSKKDTTSARQRLIEAQAIVAASRESDAATMRQRIAVALGWTLLESGQTESAIVLLRAATAMGTNVADTEARGQAWWGLARAYRPRSREAARLFYLRAVHDIDPLRPRGRDLPDTTARITFMRSYASLYRELSSLLLDMNRYEQAHYAADLMQRTELVEANWIQTRGGSEASTAALGGNPTLLDCENKITPREAKYAEQWLSLEQRGAWSTACRSSAGRDQPVCAEGRQLDSERKELEHEQSDCVDELAQVRSETYKFTTKDFRDIWEAAFVDDDVTLVVTVLEEKSLHLMLRSRATSGYIVRTQPIGRAEVEDLVTKWKKAIEEEQKLRKGHPGKLGVDSTARAAQLRDGLLRRMYEALFGDLDLILTPTARDGGLPPLVIALDGPLREFPIAALYDGQRYLGDRAAITRLTRTVAVTHEVVDAVQQPGMVMGMSALADPPLLFVADEVRRIAKVLRVDPHLDREASLVRLEDWLNGLEPRAMAQVLHIAAHGSSGGQRDSTVIQLWGGNLTGKQLEAKWLSHVRLVVLSACESAVGSGDDLALGLAGLAQLGTRSVIGSLWKVDDQATADLMEAFYMIWTAQPSNGPARALAAAQARVRKDYPHPYYWAAFTNVGRWQ
ncbi:CHAT domain-containing protein [Ralstonia nicotianae]